MGAGVTLRSYNDIYDLADDVRAFSNMPQVFETHLWLPGAGVTLRSYNVIYDLVDDVRAAMEGRLNTVEERTEMGQAEVRSPLHPRALLRKSPVVLHTVDPPGAVACSHMTLLCRLEAVGAAAAS